MAEWVRQADERGYEMGFFSETIEIMRDSVSAMAAFALASKKINIGCTQIVRLRSPIIQGQTIATLDELSEGRLILAPGACTRTHAVWNSLEPEDPVVSLKEYIAALRKIVSGEKQITWEGETIKLDRVELAWEPYRREIPMWIAATSKTGLKIAGEIGDGVMLNAVTSPEYVKNAIQICKDSCEAAGRDFSKFEIACIIVSSVEDSHDEAIEQIRWEVASKFDRIQIAFNAGQRIRVGDPHLNKEDFPKFQEAEEKGGKELLAKTLPESYVENLTASGTPEQVIARVEKFREAGVNLPVVRPAQPHQAQRLMDMFAPN
jgi:alkanesulfonate monooxygenase SsuD/methylene tetrahydromethanopterin reductase-like flavin-dependent oxidoreductase (luciferase family)